MNNAMTRYEDIKKAMHSTAMLERLKEAADASLLGMHESAYIVSAALVYINTSDDRDKILACGDWEIMLCIAEAVRDGLIPNGRDCALVPFGTTLKMMPMYQGTIKVLVISGAVLSIQSEAIFENDQFVFNMANPDRTVSSHTWSLSEDRGEIIGAWASAALPNGAVINKVITKEDIAKARAVAKSKNVWIKWPEAMSRKTAVNKLAKFIPSVTPIQDTAMEVIAKDQRNNSIEDVPFREKAEPARLEGDTLADMLPDDPEPEPPADRFGQYVASIAVVDSIEALERLADEISAESGLTAPQCETLNQKIEMRELELK